MSHRILKNALDSGANCVVVACPMCQVNLDMKQAAAKKLGLAADVPIFYLTDLVGMALGMKPSQLDVDRHFTQTKLTK